MDEVATMLMEDLSSQIETVAHSRVRHLGRRIRFGILAVLTAVQLVFPYGFMGVELHDAHAAAANPKLLNYQARITDSSGVPVADGSLSVKLAIYDASSGGNCLWSASDQDATSSTIDCTGNTPDGAITVTVNDGVFSVVLGDTTNSQNALPDGVFDGNTRYLGITVASDSEMTPRKRITSAPYAFNADRLDDLDTSSTGGTSSFVPVTDSTGNLTLTGNPQGTGIGQGSFYINPAAAGVGETIFGIADNGTALFSIDKEGDSVIGSASNTSTVTFQSRVTSSFTPETDNTYDLGDYNRRWKSLWLGGGAANIAYDTSGTSTLMLGFRNFGELRSVIATEPSIPLLITNQAGNTSSGIYLSTASDVGIGTTSPTTRLHVADTTANVATFERTNSANASIQIKDNTNNAYVDVSGGYIGIGATGSLNAGNLNIDISGAGSGNVGIGTISPASALHIEADGVVPGNNTGQLRIVGTGTAKKLLFGVDTTNDISFIQSVETSVAFRPLILNAQGGNVGIATTSPDSRFVVADVTTSNNIFEVVKVDAYGNSDYTSKYFTVSSTSTQISAGSASEPGLSFIGDPDSGLYSAGSNTLYIASGGANAMTFGAMVSVNNGKVFSVNTGSASAPGIRNNSDADTGIFFPSVGSMGFTSAGTEALRIDASQNVGIGTAGWGPRLSVADAAGSPTGNIFEVGNYGGSSKYFTVSSTSTRITGDLLSASDNTYDVGSSTLRWQDVWAGNTLNVAYDTSGTTTLALGFDNTTTLQSRITAPNTSTFRIYSGSSRIMEASSDITVLGQDAGRVDQAVGVNTFIGYRAGYSNTTSNYNTAVGSYALFSSDGGSYNTAIGSKALYSTTIGTWNTAVGANALYADTTGGYNDAFGRVALTSNTTGSSNSAFGNVSLYSNISGSNNVAVGRSSLSKSISGKNNVSVGTYALTNNMSATNTVAIGYQAGVGVSGQSYFQNTTLLGYFSGQGLTTGNNNLFLGYQAGDATTTGSDNILIGYNVDATSATASNELNIGNTIYGDLSSGNVGIGDTSPASALTVGSGDLFQVNSSGNIVKINNVTYSWPSSQAAGSGYVLSNDGAGTLTWAAASGGVSNLQGAYDGGSSQPHITLTATDGPFSLADASSALGTNLFEVLRNDGSRYFTVSATATEITNQLIVPDGTVSSPGIEFAGSSGTGLYNDGSAVNIARSGVQFVKVGPANSWFYTNVQSGSSASGFYITNTTGDGAPVYAFRDDTDSGYGQGTADNTLGLFTGGSLSLFVNTDGNVSIGNDEATTAARLLVRDALGTPTTNIFEVGNYGGSSKYFTQSSTSTLITTNLGIGDTSPASALTVGSGDLFQVNSSGNIVKINNVTYSWPSSQAAGSGYYLSNNGSGTLTWADSSTLGATSLQGAYENATSTPATIDLNATRGGFRISDESAGIGANLFEITDNNDTGAITTKYLTVSSTSTQIADYLKIGTGTSTKVDESGGDLFVSDVSEFAGKAYFKGSQVDLPTYVEFPTTSGGTTSAMRYYYNSNAAMQFLLNGKRSFTFGDFANRNLLSSNVLPTATNPTLYVFSATTYDTATDQWLSLTHDQTDAVITTGAGDLKLAPAAGEQVIVSDAAGSPTGNIFEVGNYGGSSKYLTVSSTNTRIAVGSATPLTVARSDRGEILGYEDGTDNLGFFTSDGTPESSITADRGSIAVDTTNGNLYVKTTDGVSTGWSLLDTTTANPDQVAVIVDQKAANTAGGGSSSGVNTRDLNTELYDPDGIVSISSNQFTLQPGTYHIAASAPVWVGNRNQLYLYNVTDAAYDIIGTSMYGASSSGQVVPRSSIDSVITISSAKTFEIRQYIQSAKTVDGLGVATNNGENEIYTTVRIRKMQNSGTSTPSSRIQDADNNTFIEVESTTDLNNIIFNTETYGEVLRILDNGNVGIYNANPNARLTVSASESSPTRNLFSVQNLEDSVRYLTVSSTSTLITTNLGIGDTSPASALTVGSGDLFQVNSSGNIVKINNVTYSWPSSQAAGSGYVLSNDGAGTLTWAAASGGVSNLQGAYDGGSSQPHITLTSTDGPFSLANASSALGTNLFEVLRNDGSRYFTVSATTTEVFDGNIRIRPNSNADYQYFEVDNVYGSGVTVRMGVDSTGGYVGTTSNSVFRIQAAGSNRIRISNAGDISSGDTMTADGQFTIRQNDAADIFNLYDGASNVLTVLDGGNVGIGDTSPASALTVGSGDLFQVNSSGNIVKINNVTYSWPSSQAAGSGYVLSNDGAGTLTWAAASGGASNLQGAYENATSTPATIDLNAARGGFRISDESAGIGANLFEITDNNDAGAITTKYLTVSSTSTLITTNLGIGDTSPASALTVGSGDLFQVNSSGNIVKINNVTYSWPSSQAAGSGYVLSNDGAGTLTWAAASGGASNLQGAYDGGSSQPHIALTSTDGPFSIQDGSTALGNLFELWNYGGSSKYFTVSSTSTSVATAFTLGDGGDTGSINTSDWDISPTGTITNASMTSTQLTDGGTISFDWVDAEVADALTISGGTINNSAIGATTPSSGAFTTLTSTGITTLGNNSATVAINSSDWDISTTGTITNASMTSTQLTDGGTISFDWVDAEVADALTISGGTINNSAIGATTPSSGAFTTLTSTGITTLGNNSATVAINSSDWDISTTGTITGASMTSTQLTDGGTITFDWVDAEVADALTISGGTINNSAIGATTPSTGVFTNLTVNGNTVLGNASSTDTVTFNSWVASNIAPSADDTYDLGNHDQRWRDLYLGPGSLHVGTSLTDEGTISYNTTSNILNIGTDGTSNGDIAFFTDDLYLDKSTGNLGIGDTSPASALTVGSGDLFQVNSSGNIVKLNNVTYSWPSSQAAGSGYVLSNDGAGTLTWAAASGGASNLQGAYENATSTPATIDLNAARGGFRISDESAGIGANLFEITDNNDAGAITTKYLTVSSTSTSVNGNTVLGDASGDSVTWNAGTWTVANDLAVTLSGGVNGINFDSNTLSIDATNNRVGIGDATPTQTLDVNGDIGVKGGDIVFAGTAGSYTSSDNWISGGSGYISIKPSSATYGMLLRNYANSIWANFEVVNTTVDYLTIGMNSADGPLYITDNDYVGIGTSTPDKPLEIAGALGGYGLHLDSTSGAGIEIDRAAATNAAGTLYQTAGVDKWFTGMRTDSYYRIKEGGWDGTTRMSIANTSGTVSVNQAMTVGENLSVGINSSTDDDYLYFDSNAASEYLLWQNSIHRFYLSDQLSINVDTQSTSGICSSSSATGQQELYDCSGTPSDIAEFYPVTGSATTTDILVATESFLEYQEELYDPYTGQATGATNTYQVAILDKSSEPYSDKIIGIYSTSPYRTFGEGVVNASSSTAPVGITGRVPARVTDENGSIAAGDPITTSSTAGAGMKATKPGRIVGYALEDWSGPGEGVINVLLQVGWYSGATITTDGTVSLFADDFTFDSDGLATSSATTTDSLTLSFRASAWDSASNTAVTRDITLSNVLTDKDNYDLAFLNSNQSTISKLGENGDFYIAGKLFPSDRGTLQEDKYIFYDGSVGPGGDMMRTNASGWSTGSYDFAEMFPTREADTLESGTIVIADTENDEGIIASASAYQNTILGIISTKPGFLAGENKNGDMPVALIGRVPTKVNLENGVINIGDPITSSSESGVGMKATEPGRIVGIALEKYDGSNLDENGEPTNLITVYVNPSWYNGPRTASQNPAAGSTLTIEANSIIDFQTNTLTNVDAILSASGIWSIGADGHFVAKHVQTDSISAKAYLVDSTDTLRRTVGVGEIKAGYKSVLVQNVNVTANSLIIVTFEGNPGSAWWISEKQDGQFMLELAANAPGDIRFTYWLVGVEGQLYPPPPGTQDSATTTPPVPPPPPPTDSGTTTQDTTPPPPPPTDSATTTPATPPPTDSGATTQDTTPPPPPTDSGTSTQAI